MPEEITLQAAYDAMHALAKLEPERRAECRYYDAYNDRPDCIVGWALHTYWDYPLYVLEEFDTPSTGSTSLPNINALVDRGAVRASESAQRYLCRVQSTQDAGFTWSEAVEDAESFFRKLPQE
jgi:hypothetical protein